MNDEFEEWLKNQTGTYPTIWEIELARKAWNAAIESVKPSPEFGCHVGCGNPYPDCVLDTGDYQNCGEAVLLKEEGRLKESCEYWRPIDE